MLRGIHALGLIMGLASCAGGGTVIPFANSLGETYSASSYVPLDGLPIAQSKTSRSCLENPGKEFKSIIASLPDISVRFAVAQTSGDVSVGFSPVAVTAKGSRYRAILDYINNDAIPVTFALQKTVVFEAGGAEVLPFANSTPPGAKIISYSARVQSTSSTSAEVNRLAQIESSTSDDSFSSTGPGFTEITLPIYVGLGLRVTAEVLALESGVTISGLGSFAGDSLSGGLTVQSIGINGAIVSGAIPTPSRLDQTTIENAILAIGSGRTALYAEADNSDDVTRTPRIVGLYSPIGTDPRLINAIYSELAKVEIEWKRPCAA